ncbi:MAG: hypothetical protein I8H71_01175 [Xanthomonadaceae bacterium]|nr:hypothetical protein [Xanthomonadaceae bacterium]
MALIQSDVATGKKAVPQPYDALVSKVPVDVTLPATAAANDIIELSGLPPGVALVDYDIVAPQLDSNGTPTLAFSLGVLNAGKTDLATVYETGLTFGRTASGSISRCGNAAAAQADRSAARVLGLKVTTAAATAAMAGKTFTAILHLRH